MRITYVPHARRRTWREISKKEVHATLETPDVEYPGNLGRTVAERVPTGRRPAVKVVYAVRLAELDERKKFVVTVELGRPSRREA